MFQSTHTYHPYRHAFISLILIHKYELIICKSALRKTANQMQNVYLKKYGYEPSISIKQCLAKKGMDINKRFLTEALKLYPWKHYWSIERVKSWKCNEYLEYLLKAFSKLHHIWFRNSLLRQKPVKHSKAKGSMTYMMFEQKLLKF